MDVGNQASLDEGMDTMTKPTIRTVRGVIARSAGLAPSAVSVRWTVRPHIVTYARGVQSYRGQVSVSAEGFRPRTMFVDADSQGMRVY